MSIREAVDTCKALVREQSAYLLPRQRVCYLDGAPGNGKSAVPQIAAMELSAELGFEVPCYVLSGPGANPTDPLGIPWGGVDPATGQLKGEWLAAGIWGEAAAHRGPSILVIDDTGQALQAVLAALFFLLDHRRVGNVKLDDRCLIVLTANRSIDVGSGARTAPRPLLQRAAIRYTVEVSPSEWVAWAEGEALHDAVISAIQWQPVWLNAPLQDGDSLDSSGASPRVWHEISGNLRLTKAHGLSRPALNCSTRKHLGESLGDRFLSFLSQYELLPDLRPLLANPASAPLPSFTGSDGLPLAVVLGSALANIGKRSASLLTSCCILLDRLPEESASVAWRKLRSAGLLAGTVWDKRGSV